MVYISKVYTRFGDEGQTMLASGDTVAKHSARVRAYGEVDELNAVVGLVRLELGRELSGAEPDPETIPGQLGRTLARVQQELFDLGAELATPAAVDGGAKLVIEDADVSRLEAEIDRLNEGLTPLKSFILPGGGPTATAAHLARTVCRRAERTVVEMAEREPIRPQARQYLNRLSDWCFVAARAAAKHFGHEEVLWNQQKDRD